ncbi:MAG: hypothetical protein PHF00_09330 [Elusimicrobia bacterium]|nr:hypothetical protein [Elusimicrobiota bacterium]
MPPKSAASADAVKRAEESSASRIDLVLAGLVALDVLLALWAFFAPRYWFHVFHGMAYFDPGGFLRRCGANWAAFALFQAIAWARWRSNPSWLAVVAGIRLSDIFTDWTYLAFCSRITVFGAISLAAVSPMNMILGWRLLRAHERRRRNSSGEGTA